MWQASKGGTSNSKAAAAAAAAAASGFRGFRGFRGLLFVRVYGAGRRVALDKPRAALRMLVRECWKENASKRMLMK